MLRLVLAVMASLLAALGFAAPASAQYATRVKCESWQYRPASCAIGDATSVRLANVIGGQCLQGRDWRWNRRTIEVMNGCRANFDVVVRGGNPGGGYPGGASGQLVTCESWNYRPARCAANTRGGVRMTRVRGGRCIERETWGWDRNSIWVSNGCRADFIVGENFGAGYPGAGYPGGGYPGGGYGQTIECNSRNYRPARCAAAISRGVEIERVLGGECIQGRSWGWDRGGIWVNNGCRARFRIS